MNNTKKNPNVPNLRFEIDSWNYAVLSKFATKISEKNKGITIRNVISNSATLGLIPQIDYFDKEIANNDNIDKYYIIRKGDFVYNPRKSNNAPYGPVNIYEYELDGVVSPLYLCFKINNIDKKYLYYYFKSNCWHRYMYLNGDSGARSDRVSVKDEIFFNIPISYPILEIQQKISSFLCLIDERIETQNKIIEDLKVVINQISNKIFKLEIINNSLYTLKDFLIEGEKTPVQTDKYRKITIKLNKQGLTFSETNREMADTRPFYKRYENELIIGKQNYFNGSIALVSKEYDSCICSNAIMSFKINNINKDFLYYQISNNNYINSQSYKANGTGQKELSEKEFLKFKIWIPNQSEQEEIVRCIKSFELKLETEINLLNNLILMKKYLLNNLFV